jgi:hypothetical protein
MGPSARETAPATSSRAAAGLPARAGARSPASALGLRTAPPSRAARAALRLSLASAAAAALAWPVAAPAMEVAAGADQHGRYVIHATGTIRTGGADRFRHALDQAGGRPTFLAISSGGGLLVEGVRIARMVAASRVPVVVGEVCASACFLVFAASPDRHVGPSSRVGVHRAYNRETGESAGTLDVTMNVARYAASLGVPAPIVGRMVTTPGNQRSIEWLTADDLRLMNVQYTQPAAAPQRRPATTASADDGGAAAEAAGRADRIAYRRWLGGLSETGREGAVFWQKQRSRPRPGNCLNGDSAFSLACFEAQRLWAKVDERSRDPDYRRGWEGP